MTDLRNYQMLTYIDEDIILSTLPPSFAAGGVTRRRRRRNPDSESGYDRFMSSPLAAAVLSVIVGLGLVIGLVALGRSEGPVTPVGSVAESDTVGTDTESPSETELGTGDKDQIELPPVYLDTETEPGTETMPEFDPPLQFPNETYHWVSTAAIPEAYNDLELRVSVVTLDRTEFTPDTRGLYIEWIDRRAESPENGTVIASTTCTGYASLYAKQSSSASNPTYFYTEIKPVYTQGERVFCLSLYKITIKYSANAEKYYIGPEVVDTYVFRASENGHYPAYDITFYSYFYNRVNEYFDDTVNISLLANSDRMLEEALSTEEALVSTIPLYWKTLPERDLETELFISEPAETEPEA